MTASTPFQRVVIHRAGSHDQLHLEAFEPTAPGPDEVAISVQAAGINYADVVVRMGLH